MRHLEGQKVLLTGATGAIGAAIARALAQDGANLLLQYSRNAEAAHTLAESLGPHAQCLQADLSKPEGAAELWYEAETRVGRIDALINNAGIRSEVTVDDPLADWQQVWRQEMQINFFSAVDLSREAIRHFSRHGGGRILNMASRAGQRGYSAEALPYGATKAALINFTKSVAQSFGDKNIYSMAIAPGWVRTPMAEEYIAKHGEAAALSSIPINAMAEPAEIAELSAFVLRPSQRSINGAVFDVNGASYLR